MWGEGEMMVLSRPGLDLIDPGKHRFGNRDVDESKTRVRLSD